MRRSIRYLFYLMIVPFITRAQIELLPVKHEANVILNAASLNKVFALLSKNKETVIPVFHFGDSHIQADHFTGEIRKLLQQSFGNAGRGLVFPYYQAKTNGPKDYVFKSTQKWISKKIVKSSGNIFCGIAGYTLLVDPIGRDFSLEYMPKPDSGQVAGNNKVIQLIYETVGEVPEINVFNPLTGSFAKPEGHRNYHVINKDSFVFADTAKQFNIIINRTNHPQLLLDGMVLSNGKNGLIYNSAGVNGAKFIQFLHTPKFFEELTFLKPALVIISLGTNESAGRYDSLEFILTVDSLVRAIEIMGSTVLLTTPANNYLSHKSYKYTIKKGRKRRVKTRIYVHNETVKMIRDNLVAYCHARGLPCWDLYTVMGGDYSMKTWIEAGKGAKDHLHFSKGGYIFQGQLFYSAFYAAYLKYVN
ncbi:MAG: hypothetical protein H7296_04505 [Bacteroidia bacterium]|nr:hypothetical protein [Bacteroidia bacterium]